eukprot:SAG25_NODE_13233_length_269_cov_2.347059_1_plen_60_part_01
MKRIFTLPLSHRLNGTYSQSDLVVGSPPLPTLGKEMDAGTTPAVDSLTPAPPAPLGIDGT